MWPLRAFSLQLTQCLGSSIALRSGSAKFRRDLCCSGSRSIWSDVGRNPVIDNFYDSTVEEYASKPLEQLTLRQMLDFGRDVSYKQEKILKSARYVQRELPKRLARRLCDLQFLPHVVVTNPHIRKVYNAYYHSFNILRNAQPVTTWQENAEFTQLIKRLVDEHAPMLDALASGLRECSSKPLVGEYLKLDGFLDNMLRSRISRRVIAEQHIGLQLSMPGYIGCFALDHSLSEAADFAALRCKQVCCETYGAAPEVLIVGDKLADITYIPSHIDYMLYELLKNALRAVVELHRGKHIIPPVVIHLCEGHEFITIKVSDQGGGIAERDLTRVWQYGYTTIKASDAAEATSHDRSAEGLGGDFGDIWSEVGKYSAGAARYRMAGLGFGLPLSRLYARYFGGDLKLISMPGYGVDAYLSLKRLEGYDWEEHHAEQRTTEAEHVGFA